MTDFPLAPVRRPFRALATTIVPELGAADEGVWTRVEATMGDALLSRPPRMVRQLVLFVRLVDLLPVGRFLRTFSRLDAERRRRVLKGLESAPVLAIRRGVWGLRTLVFMGYYGQRDVQTALGYRASAAGWGARGPEGARP